MKKVLYLSLYVTMVQAYIWKAIKNAPEGKVNLFIWQIIAAFSQQVLKWIFYFFMT